MSQSLGNRIFELRKARGWSQQALANLVGVAQNQISRWEGGTEAPRKKSLEALAAAFGITVTELIGDEAPA